MEVARCGLWAPDRNWQMCRYTFINFNWWNPFSFILTWSLKKIPLLGGVLLCRALQKLESTPVSHFILRKETATFITPKWYLIIEDIPTLNSTSFSITWKEVLRVGEIYLLCHDDRYSEDDRLLIQLLFQELKRRFLEGLRVGVIIE